MQYDVVVSGGGIVGVSAAIAMSRMGNSVAIIDSGDCFSSEKENFKRVYAINAASQQLLDSLSVWPLLKEQHLAPYQRMEVYDQKSKAEISFDCRSLGITELGHIIGETSLKKALYEKASTQNISFITNQTIQTKKSLQGNLVLKTQKHSISTKLLIIAEGGNSKTRALFDVELCQRPYHQHALVTTVNCEKKHNSTARQIFLQTGPLAFLPLPDANQCSIVWSTTPSEAQKLKEYDEHIFNEKIEAAIAGKLGKISVVAKRHTFPLNMSHSLQYCGENWLLLGDAAHTIHPLAGLGLNLGLADLSCWIDCAASKVAPFSVKDLQYYQRQRKTQVWKVIAMMQGLKSMFASPLSPVISLRGLGLSAINQMPVLKRFLIKQAAGL